MKIAICLSGYMRSYRVNYESLKENLIKDHDCDIFIATSSVKGNVFYKHKKYYLDKMREEGIKYVEEAITEQNLQKIYGDKLKACIIKPYNENDHLIEFPPKTHKKMISGLREAMRITHMWYFIKEADKLREEYSDKNGIKYDLVIRLRPDLLFIDEIDMKVKDISMPICYLKEYNMLVNGCNDHFAYGPPEKMTIYSNLYDNLGKYAEEVDITNRQKLLKHHLDKNKTKYDTIKCDYNLLKMPHEYSAKYNSSD